MKELLQYYCVMLEGNEYDLRHILASDSYNKKNISGGLECSMITSMSFVLYNLVFITDRYGTIESVYDEVYSLFLKNKINSEHIDKLNWLKKNIISRGAKKELKKGLLSKQGFKKMIPFIAICDILFDRKAIRVLCKYFFREYEIEVIRLLKAIKNKDDTFLFSQSLANVDVLYPIKLDNIFVLEEINAVVHGLFDMEYSFDYDIEDENPFDTLSINDILFLLKYTLTQFSHELNPYGLYNGTTFYYNDSMSAYSTCETLIKYKWSKNISIPETIQGLLSNKRNRHANISFGYDEGYLDKLFDVVVDDHAYESLDILTLFKREKYNVGKPVSTDVKISYDKSGRVNSMSLITSIKENLKMKPNPAKDKLYIEYKMKRPSYVKITVIDTNAKTGGIKKEWSDSAKEIYSKEVDVSDLAEGLHYVLIETDYTIEEQQLNILR